VVVFNDVKHSRLFENPKQCQEFQKSWQNLRFVIRIDLWHCCIRFENYWELVEDADATEDRLLEAM
jgi:hypothetical protein